MVQAQSIINKFIWSRKPSKIKHTTLIGDYNKAGLRSPDLITMRKSMRLAWIGRLWIARKSNEIVSNDLNRYGRIKLLLHSNYNTQHIFIPEFYKELSFFRSLIFKFSSSGFFGTTKNFTLGAITVY